MLIVCLTCISNVYAQDPGGNQIAPGVVLLTITEDWIPGPEKDKDGYPVVRRETVGKEEKWVFGNNDGKDVGTLTSPEIFIDQDVYFAFTAESGNHATWKGEASVSYMWIFDTDNEKNISIPPPAKEEDNNVYSGIFNMNLTGNVNDLKEIKFPTEYNSQPVYNTRLVFIITARGNRSVGNDDFEITAKEYWVSETYGDNHYRASINLKDKSGEDKLFDFIYVTRTFEPNKWYTLCLPFHLDETELRTYFGSGMALMQMNSVTSIAADNLTYPQFNYVRVNELEPGKPYLLYVRERITNPTIRGPKKVSADIIRKTKCSRFFERIVLFSKTKRSSGGFYTPLPTPIFQGRSNAIPTTF